MSVMSSQLDRLMDRLVVERAIDTITIRQIEAVLRKYDANVQTATVDNLIARPTSFRITAAECEATARRIIAGRTADAHKCQACDGTGWAYIPGVDVTDRGEVTPCHQCQRERAAGWRTEMSTYRSVMRHATVDILTAEQHRDANEAGESVKDRLRSLKLWSPKWSGG
jgi:excinuclease UvrABC ATPase subunit